MSVRRHRIAAILPLELEYSGRLLAGAAEYARGRRWVGLVDVPYSADAPARLRLAKPLPFDAALIWATHEATWVERLLEGGVPMVAASGDWPVERVPCVAFDAMALVEAAVGHLARLRPALLVNLQFRITGVPLMEGRARLFAGVAGRSGIPSRSVELIRAGDGDDSVASYRRPLSRERMRRLRSLLREVPRPVAIWCGEDTLGLHVSETAEALGLRVPADVAVLGTGDFRIAECAKPPLSSVPLPGERVGYRAFEVLDQRLSGRTGFPPFIPVLPPPVVARESTLGASGGDPLRRALALIAARACDGITVAEVASAAGMSPQALHARFMQWLGHPPGEEIRCNRLAAAKRYLHDPRFSIARVACLCGFNQQSKFTNFFRRGTGLSPRAWREANP